jgi:hypothetical protein
MSSTLFTTSDGDIILRAGQDPNSKHDFRVHKFILSLASPVFKDMFTFPQPPDQNRVEKPDISIVDVLDPPKVLDAILRFIYPGVEPPEIPDLPTLSALLSTADKYNITSIYPVLKGTLKTFLPRHPFGVYVVACRFGFAAEAKEAAKVSNTQSIISRGFDEEVRHISITHLLRFSRFVQERECEGRSKIQELLSWWHIEEDARCNHWEDAKDFYFRLEKAVEVAFSANPCVGHMELCALLDKVPDPPPGCKPEPDSAEDYYDACAEDKFACPLKPMAIRSHLGEVAKELETLTRTMLDETFEKEVGSG